jgi:hypothetical protein
MINIAYSMNHMIPRWPIFLVLWLLAASTSLQAQFEYTANSDGVSITITNYTGPGGAVVIPNEIAGLTVTGIGDEYYPVFSNSLTGITIPSSVTSIGPYTFLACSGLTNVTIPDSVTDIKDAAFGNCSNLSYVNIPDSVTDIEELVFYDTSLTNITIPNSVTNLGGGAFADCTKLTSITIPGSVITLGIAIFQDDPYSDGTFDGCTGLTNVTLSYGLASIGYLAFSDCTNLTRFTIPDSVTNIGVQAFQICINLTDIVIPNSVTTLGNNAFEDCPKMTNVTIGHSVINIDEQAFIGCYGLTNITIPASTTNIGPNAFGVCTNLVGAFFAGNTPTVSEPFSLPDGYSWDTDVTVYYLPGATGWSNTFAGVPAVLWNPVIQTTNGNFGVENNQFGFNITGTANIPVQIEACTNLSNSIWTPLQTLTLTNGSAYFSDPQWSNFPTRFYALGFP